MSKPRALPAPEPEPEVHPVAPETAKAFARYIRGQNDARQAMVVADALATAYRDGLCAGLGIDPERVDSVRDGEDGEEPALVLRPEAEDV